MANEEIKNDAAAVSRAVSAMSYGLYAVTSFDGKKVNGQLANTVFQVTASPPRVAASLHKSNLTHEYVKKSGLYTVSVLERETPMTYIGVFGFKSGHDSCKCEKVVFKNLAGCPAAVEHALAIFTVKVEKYVDVGTHTLFIGEVIAGEVLKEGVPLTYDYYKTVKRGKTQKNATTFNT